MKSFNIVLPSLLLGILSACGGGGSNDGSIDPPAVASISVSPPSPSLLVGDSVQLTASLFDSSGKPVTGQSVTWSSADADTASVTAGGLVTANKAGTVRIVAAVGNVEGNTNVSIADRPLAAVDRVEISPSLGVIVEGGTQEFTATAYDAQNHIITGRGVTWHMLDPGIAGVDPGGVVTALRSGATTLSVTVEGRSAQASVRVTADYGYELVYSRAPTSGGSGLFTLDINDPAASAMPLIIDGITPTQVAPSPDGLRIAVVAIGVSSSSIWVADRDGRNAAIVFADGSFADQPAWSPDGQRIAFRRQLMGDGSDIWVMNANGTDAVNLSGFHGATSQRSPTWSPVLGDGSQWIAYSHADGGSAQIWAVRADGTLHRQVTTATNVFDDQPTWSPDGARIVFQRSGDAIFGDLYVVNASGGNGGLLMQLAGPLAFGQFWPSWSPDGQMLAFISEHDGDGAQVYTVWFDGTRVARRTFDVGNHDFPRWLLRVM